MSISNEEIRHRMGYHRATFPPEYDPKGDIPLAGFAGDSDENGELATGPIHSRLRQLYIELADELILLVPQGREQSLAMTELQASLMWANAGVAMLAKLIEE